MKKGLLVVISLLLLTGCFEPRVKTLDCSKENNDIVKYGKAMTYEKIKYDTKEKKLSLLSYTLAFDISNEKDLSDDVKKKVINSINSNFTSLCDKYKEAKSCKVSSNTSYDIRIEVIGDRGLINKNLANYDNYDDLKAYYEAEGYTCNKEL